MKIQSKNLVSTKLIAPFDGLIEIDSNGIAEVSAKAGSALLNSDNNWQEVSSTDADANQEDQKSEEEKVVAGIKKMKIADMIALAKGAEYPEAEWSKFTSKEKLMQGYLIKKYNEMKLAADTEEEGLGEAETGSDKTSTEDAENKAGEGSEANDVEGSNTGTEGDENANSESAVK